MRKTVLGRATGYVGLAKDMRAVKRASDETVRDNARRHLAQRMGKLRGLPQKIGQIMSMSDDAGQADAFADLREQAEPLPLDELKPALEQQWGGSVDTVLAGIEPDGHAASLGQVHRAKLHTGEDVAIKIAYPGIDKAVMNDLKMLGWLSAPVGDLRRGFNLADYRAEIVRDLTEELEYQTEIEHQQRYAEFATTVDGLIVPKPYTQWSGHHVLVSSWEDGDDIEATSHWPQPARADLARKLVRHFLTALFDHNFVHADPHPGNYRFRLDPQHGASVVLYDYGSVVRLSERDCLLLMRLICDTTSRSGDPLSVLTSLGFDETLLSPITRKLPALCSVLFEPFANPAKFDLDGWNRSERIDDILGDDRWNFRMASPAKLILLMRAFRGVLYYLERLGESVSWERLFAPIVARHQHTMATLDIPASKSRENRFESMAKHLRIEVKRGGVTKVSLTFPATTVDDLDGLVDEELAVKIAERDIDIAKIVRETRSRGYTPGPLFELDEPDEDRHFRVWME